MIRALKRKMITQISKLFIFVFGLISNIFNLTSLETGLLNRRIGYFLCNLFSSHLISLLIYKIFFSNKSINATRLQEIETYRNFHCSSKYRVILLGLEKTLFGKILVWRNKNTKKIKFEKKEEKKEKKILFVTRSWHFFEPLYIKIKDSQNNNINKFDINEYDKIYLKTSEKKINKNKVFRDLIFSSLKNARKLDNINDYSKLKKLKENDLKNLISSDIIFVDWLNQNTLWVLENIPLDKKIVVRVHSYEVFSFYALMLNYGRIDGLIFISEGIKNVFLELWDWLLPDGIEITVLQNVRSKERLEKISINRLENNKRSKTLGMLQYSVEVKDLNFALDVFEKLYKFDNEYKLLLAGNKLDENNSYSKKLLNRIDTFPTGSIEELGYITEMNEFFDKVGFILSTSEREGSHESVIEGMVFGCVPAIRDWPLLSPFNGAKLSFPQFPNFKTPVELATYIENSQNNFEELSKKSKRESSYYFDENMDRYYLDFINKNRGKK